MSWPGALAGFVALVLTSSASMAHGTLPGPGGAAYAFVHSFIQPPVPLVALGLGLLAGAQSAFRPVRLAAALAAGILCGVISILVLRLRVDPLLPLSLLAAGAALSVASGHDMPAPILPAIFVVSGYLLGIFIAPGPASLSTVAYAVIGSASGLTAATLAIACLAAGLRSYTRCSLMQIVLRVFSAWIGAIALLYAAFLLRKLGI